MAPVLLGVVVLILILLLLRGFAFADPKALVRVLRFTGAGVLGVVTLLLFFTGRVAPAFFVGSMAWGLATGGHIWPSAWPHFPGAGGWRAKPASGGSTAVRTGWIEMELDHDSGEMQGAVLKGAFAGRTLDHLKRDEVLAFFREAASDDAETGRLLEAYLDRRFGPEWRADAGRDQANASSGAGMSRDEALKVLGLTGSPAEHEIRAAHRRLMLQNHPDRGGSDYLAAKINQARDVLLGV